MKKELFVIPTFIKDVKSYLQDQRCPICDEQIERSNYLESIFKDDIHTLWIANLVTHYRHNHITSWNKCWERHGGYYRGHWFGKYEDEKLKINERAKRQLLRKGWKILKENGVTVETFKKLENSSLETITLAEKLLAVNIRVK